MWAFPLFPCRDVAISSPLPVASLLDALCRALCFWMFIFEILTWMLQMPSHLPHESTILRDQVCHSSNKGGCFVTHTLFAIYKPVPLDCTAHLSPPPSRSLATSIFAQYHPTKVRISTVAPAHPLERENTFV